MVTRSELEYNRRQGYMVYGYKHSYCDSQRSCDECDKVIRIGCKVIRVIEDLQIRQILKICKEGE